MQRNTRRIIAAVAVIALLAAGGAAFTNQRSGLDGNNANIGFGSETVTGAAATNVNYALSSDGQFVDEVAVTLTGDGSHTGYTFTGAVTDGTGHNGAGGTIVQSGTLHRGFLHQRQHGRHVRVREHSRHSDHRCPRGLRGRLRAVSRRQQQLRHERDARRRLADQLSGRESPDNWSGLSPPRQPDRG